MFVCDDSDHHNIKVDVNDSNLNSVLEDKSENYSFQEIDNSSHSPLLFRGIVLQKPTLSQKITKKQVVV